MNASQHTESNKNEQKIVQIKIIIIIIITSMRQWLVNIEQMCTEHSVLVVFFLLCGGGGFSHWIWKFRFDEDLIYIYSNKAVYSHRS